MVKHRDPITKINFEQFAKRMGFKSSASPIFRRHLYRLRQKGAVVDIYEIPKKIAVYDWQLIEAEFGRKAKPITTKAF